ncbi:MAG TPA: hypothetical protein VEF06_00525 [Bryobacteraceae bacterium]|nr:hypothetical protein [Bryobacteraceae bacterium]
MFQKKPHSRSVIERDGSELRISVAPPGSVLDEWMAGAVFLGMVTGSFFGFWPLNPGRLALAFLFSAAAFFIFRGIYEQNAAEQILAVQEGKIACVRRTRLWTRTRWLNVRDVTEVSAGSAMGVSGVTIVAKGRKHLVLTNILRADAEQCAREIRNALGTS